MAKKGRQNKVSQETANPNVTDTEFSKEMDTKTAKKGKNK